jgi:hypothetical protein
MDLTIIVSVVAIVAVAAVSERIAVAVPLSLVVVGIALSFLPSLPKIDVDPHWILAENFGWRGGTCWPGRGCAGWSPSRSRSRCPTALRTGRSSC